MKNEREERKILENRIYEIIMKKKENFTVKELVEDLTATVSEEIDKKKILEVVFTALDYCLSESYIDIVDSYSYMVNPVIQAELEDMEEEAGC